MSWLWKSDANSPASFEKALSKLSTQIADATVALEATQSRSRRSKALWTLYTVVTYLLYSLIVTLVLGPQRWAAPHYVGLVGGPFLIYGVRRGLVVFYDWRIKRQQTYINGLQKQRDSKIADLKKATKYDSTQELLQKYGGGPPKFTPSKTPDTTKKSSNKTPQKIEQRTGIAPPPTANIPGRTAGTLITPQRVLKAATPNSSAYLQTTSPHPAVMPGVPEFAPNAFPASSVIRPHLPHTGSYESGTTHHWYDRILDVLLGEDEVAAKNRLALLCTKCRLVNGLAPPGVKTLEEVGKWRCSNCGALNGVENEGAKVVKEMVEQARAEAGDLSPSSPAEVEKHGDSDTKPLPAETDDHLHDDPSLKEAKLSTHSIEGKAEEALGIDSAQVHEDSDQGGLTKRITRSAARKGSMESL